MLLSKHVFFPLRSLLFASFVEPFLRKKVGHFTNVLIWIWLLLIKFPGKKLFLLHFCQFEVIPGNGFYFPVFLTSSTSFPNSWRVMKNTCGSFRSISYLNQLNQMLLAWQRAWGTLFFCIQVIHSLLASVIWFRKTFWGQFEYFSCF